METRPPTEFEVAPATSPPSTAPAALRTMFRSASVLFSGGMAVAVLAFVQGIYVTHTLGPAQYGTWGVVVAFAGLVNAVIGTNCSNTLTRFLVEYRAQDNRDRLGLLLASILAFDGATSLLAYLVVLVVAPLVAPHLTGGRQITPLYVVYGATLLCNFPYSTWYSLTRDRKRFATLATVPTVIAALQLVLILALWATSRLELRSLAVVYLAMEVLRCTISTFHISRDLAGIYGLRLTRLPFGQVWRRRAEMKEMWRFLASIYLSTSFSTLFKNGDVLILGACRPAAEVGYYRLAKGLVAMLQGIGQSLGSATYQDFNEMVAAHDMPAVMHRLQRLNRHWVPLVAAATVLAMTLAQPLLRLVYGVAFAPAAPLFCWMLLGPIASTGLFWAYPLALALDQHRFYLKTMAVSAVVITALMGVAGRMVGAAGVAVLSSLLWWVVFCTLAARCLTLLRAPRPPVVRLPSAVQPHR